MNQSQTIKMQVLLEPADDSDVYNLSIVTNITEAFVQDVTHLTDISLISSSNADQGTKTRDISALLLLGKEIAEQAALVTSIFEMVASTLKLLSKHKYIHEVILMADGKVIIIHEISKQDAESLIGTFTTQHPNALVHLSSNSKVKLIAKVKKTN